MATLGIISGRDVSVAPDGSLRAYLAHARLVNILAEEFDHIELIAPLTPSSVRHDGLIAEGISFRPLPEISSTFTGVAKTIQVWRALRSYEETCDKILVQVPFPSPYALLGLRKPTTVYGVGDVQSVVSSGAQRSITGQIYRLAAFGSAAVFRRIAGRPGNNVVTNGSELLDRFPGASGEWMISSGLLASELNSVDRERLRSDRFRILFVGYIRVEKGFHVLCDSVAELLDRGADVELRVVAGSVENRAGLGDDWIDEQLAKLPDDRVVMTGHKQFGPELFQEFADADVLVLPSFSEGTPRVLVEARAFGCPVVASRVGGIPDSVEDNADGHLFDPGDCLELAGILMRLIDDPAERHRLIQNGSRSVTQYTVESMAGTLSAAIKKSGAEPMRRT